MSYVAWSDARTARLKELWAEGWSASQIAKDLGHVSRNGVISKVHRLGLARRRTTVSTPRGPRIQRPKYADAYLNTKLHQRAHKKAVPPPKPRCEPKQANSVVVPIAKRLSIEGLTARNCHWPIGDPRHADFHYCGHDAEPGKAYCPYHDSVAHVRMTVKEALRASDRIANACMGGKTGLSRAVIAA